MLPRAGGRLSRERPPIAWRMYTSCFTPRMGFSTEDGNVRVSRSRFAVLSHFWHWTATVIHRCPPSAANLFRQATFLSAGSLHQPSSPVSQLTHLLSITYLDL